MGYAVKLIPSSKPWGFSSLTDNQIKTILYRVPITVLETGENLTTGEDSYWNVLIPPFVTQDNSYGNVTFIDEKYPVYSTILQPNNYYRSDNKITLCFSQNFIKSVTELNTPFLVARPLVGYDDEDMHGWLSPREKCYLKIEDGPLTLYNFITGEIYKPNIEYKYVYESISYTTGSGNNNSIYIDYIPLSPCVPNAIAQLMYT